MANAAGTAGEKESPEQRPGSYSHPAASRCPGDWEALGWCPWDLISGGEDARPAGRVGLLLLLGRDTSAFDIAPRRGFGTVLAGLLWVQRDTVLQAVRGELLAHLARVL